jgi:archaellin
MKKNLFAGIIAMLTVGIMFTSCSDDKTPVVDQVAVSLEIPANLENVELSNVSLVMTNVATQEAYVASGDNVFSKNDNKYQLIVDQLEEGNYNISINGHLDFELNNIAGQKDFEVTSENVKISATSPAVQMVVSTFAAQGGFVISEIFFTGTSAEGKSYSGDQYIRITNNSDVTLYADSIAVLESAFLTTTKQDYTPDIMSTDFSVQACYMIPGTGKSVAVEPGASLTLAINAIDHTVDYPNSFDLSNADFEFYDESSNPNFTDPDGKAPNLDKWYCYTASVYQFHSRGFNSMAIAKMKTTKEDWLENYVYDANYLFVFGDFSKEMTKKGIYRVPNSWILDGVNLSVESVREWNVLDASIDAGWTYCGKVDKDDTRFNKSVIRKQDANGKYIDTNNSTNDFTPEAPASLLK